MISRARSLAAALTFALTLTAAAAVAQAESSYRLAEGDTTLPRWNIKTNLLYDLTATINLGAEFRVGDNLSLDIPFNYNPWTFSDNRKWKHFLVQPELRWWPGREVFSGHFFGVHAHYAFYNLGNLPHGPFSEYMQQHRFQGDAYGLGGSWGYRWNFNHRWGLEATVGVGYVYKDYNVFECQTCGDFIASEKKHYFGPTKVGLSLVYGIGGKRAVEAPVLVPPPAPVYTPPTPYEPNLSTSYVIPDVESPKVRSQSYTAYLDFEQGRSEIIRNLHNNASELRRIDDITRRVAEDGNSTISRISITGYASPEDTYERNQSLSERRTSAVRDYVNNNYSNLDRRLFTVSGEGEDWDTLDSLVEASSLAEKRRVLEIIRGGGHPDARENELKQLSGGAVYRRIFDEFYPRLRRTDYRVDYTVIAFSVEEGKRVFRSNPQNLSLNEMYLIAKTYEPGGRAFNEVFEKAVGLFPQSDVANINAAAAALERNDTTSAASYLSRVRNQTSAYWNNLGVLNWLQGNAGAAADCFSRAGIQSAGNSREMERHIRSVSR
jgi:outer membrane protein OmpA-like peptidoglycan-associated protein